MSQYHSSSSPSTGGDPFEFELTSLLGIAITRRKLAQDVAAELRTTCADAAKTVTADCVALLHAEGKADAWDGAITLLIEALAAKRRTP